MTHGRQSAAANGVGEEKRNPATGFMARGRSAPHILSEYLVLDTTDPESVLDETIAHAMSVGWVFDESEPHLTPSESLRIEATKDFGLSILGELNLSLSRDRESLIVRLTYPQAIP